MLECPHQSILCPAQGCRFINNVVTVLINSINCPFNLFYCAICKSLYNVSVLTHYCNIIKSQRSILSYFKYYHDNLPLNHLHKHIFLKTNSYNKTFEVQGKINYYMCFSVALLNLHRFLFLFDKFDIAKIKLKIFHLFILYRTNITFILICFVFSKIN